MPATQSASRFKETSELPGPGSYLFCRHPLRVISHQRCDHVSPTRLYAAEDVLPRLPLKHPVNIKRRRPVTGSLRPSFPRRCANGLEDAQYEAQLVTILMHCARLEQRPGRASHAFRKHAACSPQVHRRTVRLVPKEDLGRAVWSSADVEDLGGSGFGCGGQLRVPCGAEVGQVGRAVW